MSHFRLILSAHLRRPTESILTILCLTTAFTVINLMAGLWAGYDIAIENARMDRIFVNGEISEELKRDLLEIGDIKEVGTFQWLYGMHEQSNQPVGIVMMDDSMSKTWEELLTEEEWLMLNQHESGLFFSKKMAKRWKVKAGDSFEISVGPGVRQDQQTFWIFKIIDIIPDPKVAFYDGVIIGSYEKYRSYLEESLRGNLVSFRISIDRGANAEKISSEIDQKFATTKNPTISTPEMMDAVMMAGTPVNMRVGTKAIAIIVFIFSLIFASIGFGQSVTERSNDFRALHAIGFGRKNLSLLIVGEISVLVLLSFLLGVFLAYFLSKFASYVLSLNIVNIRAPILEIEAIAVTAVYPLLMIVIITVISIFQIKSRIVRN